MPTRAQVAAGLRQHRMRGVTLIELMVVLAIVAILSSLAVGSYRRYVLRANRTDATSALLRIQVGEEKYFLQNNSYTANATAAPPTGLGVASPTPNGFYIIAVTGDPNSTNNIATSFRATATAQGTQTQDTSCLTLTINDQGQRTSPSTTDCWR
ncbi:MAG: type IV pilin protein [Gammaproteobacteria bacterium]|nr:MAG: type IV pilin protein [Gammaproteobacteria bacterium]TLZ32888.1 MAG: type IV pilin protein [Gammaproteobacteria bacterium]